MNIKHIAVIGSGTMGNGIAHVFALFGYDVVLIDTDQAILDRGLQQIEHNLQRQAGKQMLTQDECESVRNRISCHVGVPAHLEVYLAVEAVTENLKIKQAIFAALDTACPSTAIFASNTSSISITELAASTQRPDQVVGMHFMNPVPVMKLVELIRGVETSDETFDAVHALTLTLDKVPAEAHDYPGFVSNRVLMPMINEAIYCVMEGVARPEAIDTVMRLGMNHPMGPLALADFIGLDVCLAIMEVLHQGFGDDKYRPCPLLKKKVVAGHLGRKSGLGFYQYEGR